jgi:hypothetical protein
MKLQVEMLNERISITESRIDDVYYIQKYIDDDLFKCPIFCISSKRGYSDFECGGSDSFKKAFNHVEYMIKNYFRDRGEDNPKGW